MDKEWYSGLRIMATANIVLAYMAALGRKIDFGSLISMGSRLKENAELKY